MAKPLVSSYSALLTLSMLGFSFRQKSHDQFQAGVALPPREGLASGSSSDFCPREEGLIYNVLDDAALPRPLRRGGPRELRGGRRREEQLSQRRAGSE